MPRLVLACAVLAALAIFPRPAQAVRDWNRTSDPMTYAVGLHAGKIGGMGLAFVVPATWYLQVQVAGGVWNTRDNHRWNAGLELHYILRQDPRLRLYLVAGAAHYVHDERVAAAGGDDWRTDESTNAGFGVGIERLIGDRWSVKVDLDFTYEGDDDEVSPWPQAGVFFYW